MWLVSSWLHFRQLPNPITRMMRFDWREEKRHGRSMEKGKRITARCACKKFCICNYVQWQSGRRSLVLGPVIRAAEWQVVTSVETWKTCHVPATPFADFNGYSDELLRLFPLISPRLVAMHTNFNFSSFFLKTTNKSTIWSNLFRG